MGFAQRVFDLEQKMLGTRKYTDWETLFQFPVTLQNNNDQISSFLFAHNPITVSFTLWFFYMSVPIAASAATFILNFAPRTGEIENLISPLSISIPNTGDQFISHQFPLVNNISIPADGIFFPQLTLNEDVIAPIQALFFEVLPQ